MTKTYIIDTNVILEDPNIVRTIQGEILIPTTVLQELDAKKYGDAEKNRNARVGRIQSRQERIAARKARIAARSARIAARNDRIKLRAQRAEAAKTAEQTKSDS